MGFVIFGLSGSGYFVAGYQTFLSKDLTHKFETYEEKHLAFAYKYSDYHPRLALCMILLLYFTAVYIHMGV